MPSARVLQSSFAAGIIGARLRGRVDLQQYAAGAEELTNIRVLTSGGATRRPGSYYVCPGGAQPVRLVPFRVSTEAAYVLIFGDNTLQFIRNRGRLLNGSAAPVEIATPWASADLAALRFAQSADVLYCFHPSYQPRKLSRTSADEFNLALLELANGPYDAENTGDVGAAAASSTTSDPVVTIDTGTATGTGTTTGSDATGTGYPSGEGGGGTEAAGGESGSDAGGGVGEG